MEQLHDVDGSSLFIWMAQELPESIMSKLHMRVGEHAHQRSAHTSGVRFSYMCPKLAGHWINAGQLLMRLHRFRANPSPITARALALDYGSI